MPQRQRLVTRQRVARGISVPLGSANKKIEKACLRLYTFRLTGVRPETSRAFTGPGTLVSEEYSAMKDAPEKLLVHVEAKKR